MPRSRIGAAEGGLNSPVVFAALLDLQPPDSYAQAQAFHDSIAGGAELRPTEFTTGRWHCTLWPSTDAAHCLRRREAASPATPRPNRATVPDSGTTASISASLAGSVVSGLVPVKVTTGDTVSVSKVELWVNGALYATDISNPYSFNWDSTRVADGNADLQAAAHDAAGDKSVSAIVTSKVSNTTTASPGGQTLTGSSTSQGSRWTVIVTVPGVAAGTMVSGSWNVGGTPDRCTVSSSGTCTITRPLIVRRPTPSPAGRPRLRSRETPRTAGRLSFPGPSAESAYAEARPG